METVGRFRAMASLCRQTAAYHPDRSWKLLAEAEYWEHLANDALLDHFEQCYAAASSRQPIGGNANTTQSVASIAA